MQPRTLGRAIAEITEITEITGCCGGHQTGGRTRAAVTDMFASRSRNGSQRGMTGIAETVVIVVVVVVVTVAAISASGRFRRSGKVTAGVAGVVGGASAGRTARCVTVSSTYP